MKKKTGTGVRKLSPEKLKPLVDAWLANDGQRRSWNSLSTEMIKVPGGKGVNGADLKRLFNGGSYNMSAEAQFALCTVLKVHVEEISESLDQ